VCLKQHRRARIYAAIEVAAYPVVYKADHAMPYCTAVVSLEDHRTELVREGEAALAPEDDYSYLVCNEVEITELSFGMAC